MKRIIACALAVLTMLAVSAQLRSDSVKVYFHISQWQCDPALDDNAASIDSFIEKVRLAEQTDNLDRIVIRAYASPDGSANFNRRLSAKRCNTVAKIIEERAGLAPSRIETYPEGVAWDELRHLVAATPDVPMQEQVLDILDNTPVWIFDAKGRIVDGRKRRLMNLGGGRPYRWLLHNIFPRLRNAVAVSLILKTPDVCVSEEGAYPPPSDTVDVADGAVIGEIGVVEEAHEAVADTVPALVADTVRVDAPVVADDYAPRHVLALKTNLLEYGILMPNLEVEWLINEHWSVAAEGNLAWWGRYAKDKSYRICVLDAEVRRWIKPRAPWHGMYVGLTAGGGWYDLLKDSPGYRGEGLMTGLTFGYMWPIGRCLSLEAGLGVGYVYTRVKEYDPIDGHHVYLRTKDLNYFGPIKLKLSLAWRLFDQNKLKRKISAL